MAKQVRFKSKEKDVDREQHDREFCCRISFKGAASIVVVLEALYCFYCLLILVFTIVNHRQAWSITAVSINLFILGVQVVIAGVGIWKENSRLLLIHLIFLVLCLIWDLLVTIAFFTLATYTNANGNSVINYNGGEFNDINTRVFGIVMGFAMLIFYVIRFVTTWIIWKYWSLLRRKERQRHEFKYRTLSTMP